MVVRAKPAGECISEPLIPRLHYQAGISQPTQHQQPTTHIHHRSSKSAAINKRRRESSSVVASKTSISRSLSIRRMRRRHNIVSASASKNLRLPISIAVIVQNAWIFLYLFFFFLFQPAAHIVAAFSTQHPMRIPEHTWRSAAAQHKTAILELLQPGLITRQHGRNKNNNSIITSSLDPLHPIYNFLIEYYGLKGAKGVKRLVRWSPGMSSMTDAAAGGGGILLQGATPDDFADTLHLRGCTSFEATEGALYCPQQYGAKQKSDAAFVWYRDLLKRTLHAEPVLYCYGLHEWSMLYPTTTTKKKKDGCTTTEEEKEQQQPPSAQYQSHLPLRVSPDVIRATVQRKGTHCTHVDALSYFSPDALPWQQNPLQARDRAAQLEWEQPGCVHAHMDLLKMALKLGPFLAADVLVRILQVVLAARTLDVAASPYSVVLEELVIQPVPIETAAGRVQYRQRQMELMETAQIVRNELLQAYNTFLDVAFGEKGE